MKLWIGVENFAKIEKAEICIDNYTVLVGPNNSGKTFLMQLVQGISNKLSYLLDESVKDIFLKNDNDAYKEFVIDSENINELISSINNKLITEKDALVREIFGKSISAERIYIDAVMDEGVSYSIIMADAKWRNEVKEMIHFAEDVSPYVFSIFHKVDEGFISLINRVDKQLDEIKTVSMHWSITDDETFAFSRLFEAIMESKSLFLPASRTGLLLLYRDFFANRTDSERLFVLEGDRFVENQERAANLTKPVYEFLRFLQTYSEQDEVRKKFESELAFFEKHLIEGHISVDKQGIFSYNSSVDANVVPMYLASSMIKEIAPLVLALSSKTMYNRLIIDEVEASLHPQKQLELVRFLNRLNNKGMKLIVSTHSDTFASKLSNLYVLSELARTKGDAVLKQFELEKEDLITPERLHVYEFVMQPNGKSIVKSIQGDKKAGFQFDAFTDSALHLYEEGVKLGEVQ